MESNVKVGVDDVDDDDVDDDAPAAATRVFRATTAATTRDDERLRPCRDGGDTPTTLNCVNCRVNRATDEENMMSMVVGVSEMDGGSETLYSVGKEDPDGGGT